MLNIFFKVEYKSLTTFVEVAMDPVDQYYTKSSHTASVAANADVKVTACSRVLRSATKKLQSSTSSHPIGDATNSSNASVQPLTCGKHQPSHQPY